MEFLKLETIELKKIRKSKILCIYVCYMMVNFLPVGCFFFSFFLNNKIINSHKHKEVFFYFTELNYENNEKKNSKIFIIFNK